MPGNTTGCCVIWGASCEGGGGAEGGGGCGWAGGGGRSCAGLRAARATFIGTGGGGGGGGGAGLSTTATSTACWDGAAAGKWARPSSTTSAACSRMDAPRSATSRL